MTGPAPALIESRPAPPLIVALLLVLGIEFWLVCGGGRMGPWWMPATALLAGAVVALVPPLRKTAAAAIAAIRHPSQVRRSLVAILIAAFASIYLFGIASLQGRDFAPNFHDEYQFLLQARMLASGRLWMPAHPLPDFFDTFYVLTTPVYAAQGFPGLALLLAPAVALGVPYWLVMILCAGVSTGLLYRIVTELLDGVAGLLAAMIFLAGSLLRMVSVMALAQLPALMLGLAMVWAWLGWRRQRSHRWSALIGAFAGFAAITRPADALCFAIPVGVAMLWQMRGARVSRLVATAACLMVAAGPFLVLQMAFNRGVSGSWLKTPFALYNERDQPGLEMGFGKADVAASPLTIIPQKRQMYAEEVLPAIQGHSLTREAAAWRGLRMPMLLGFTELQRGEGRSGLLLLLVLMPVGLLGLRCTARWVLWSSLPLFAVIYSLYPLFAPHYMVVVAPAAALTVVMGLAAVESSIANRWRDEVSAGLVTIVVVLTLPSLVPLGRLNEGAPSSPLLRRVDAALTSLARGRAVVLFTPHPQGNFHDEPVYNIATAWPDDAIVIRAHDLGSRNVEIFGYYATHDPGREFYRFDRNTGTLERLGTAAERAR